MSDSDDTDFLLRIAPDSFTLNLDESEKELEKSLVEELVTQVTNLESRVNNMEMRGDFVELQSTIDSNMSDKYDKDRMLDGFSSDSPPKRLALPEVDKLLKEMEETQNEIENKLRAKEIEFGIGEKTPDKKFKEDIISSTRQYKLGDNIGSVPDLGFGARDLYYPRKEPCTEEPFVRRENYLVGSSNPGEEMRKVSARKELKFPEKRIISPRRRLSSDFSPKPKTIEHNLAIEALRDEPKPKTETHNFFKQPRGNLLSLANLWTNENEHQDDPTKIRQKLQEEKYRRLHLENEIQALNKKVLEEQEKLAVAMRVDEGKDKAIGKITESWKKMVEHWKEIEAERHSMSKQLISERTFLKKAQDDKIERWEKEVSQALDLAAGYKTKCEYLESELDSVKNSLESKILDLEEKMKLKDLNLYDLANERERLASKLQISEDEHQEEKKIVDMLKTELAELKEKLSDIEAELSITNEQKGLISARLKEEKSQCLVLDQQKKHLQEALTEAKNEQLKAKDEAKSAIEQLETSKSELRSLYQNQLETVVRDKLAEFQGQLDAAQSAMQAEIESNRRLEKQRTEQQLQSLVTSHICEMRKLESIHKEEIRDLSLKLADSERRRTRLENRKKDIAQKLHGVMETQWQQALNIITSDLSMRQGESEVGQGDYKKDERYKPDSDNSEDVPFNKDDVVTYRSSNPKPVAKQDQLLKYIQQLLDKQPGKPVDSSTSSNWAEAGSETLDQSLRDMQWHQIINSANLIRSQEEGINPNSHSKKPPWK